MSQVKNLRAMFEGKRPSNDADRGRSPLLLPRILGDSPRPLSRVRTNFVAIEKDGRVGLQLEGTQSTINTPTTATFQDSTLAPHSLELSISDHIASAAFLNTEVATPMNKTTKKKEQPAETSLEPGIKEYLPLPDPKPTPIVTQQPEKQQPEPEVIEPNVRPAAKEQPIIVQAMESEPKAVKKKEPETPTSNVTKNSREPIGEPKKTLASTTLERSVPTHRSTTSQSTHTPSRPAPKARSKTPGPSLCSENTDRATARSLAREKSVPADLTKTPATRSRSRAGGSALRSQSRPGEFTKRSQSRAVNPVTRTPVFVHKNSPSKVQTRSPTRPEKPTESLTSATAASAFRFSKGSCSDLRSAAKPSPKNRERAASRTASRGPGLRRQPSFGNPEKKAHASVGPPPKKKDTYVVRQPKEADESFLARMMRPTQSSKSKVIEKVLTTPPRKNTTPKRLPARSGSVGPTGNRSAPSSAQKSRATSRPTSKIISPSRATRGLESNRNSMVRSISKSSAGTQTYDLPEPPHFSQSVPRIEGTHSVGDHATSDSVVTEANLPRTPEALLSLDTSMIASNDAMDNFQHGESVEKFLGKATEVLNNVVRSTEQQKPLDTIHADGDVFGMPDTDVKMITFETY